MTAISRLNIMPIIRTVVTETSCLYSLGKTFQSLDWSILSRMFFEQGDITPLHFVTISI